MKTLKFAFEIYWPLANLVGQRHNFLCRGIGVLCGHPGQGGPLPWWTKGTKLKNCQSQIFSLLLAHPYLNFFLRPWLPQKRQRNIPSKKEFFWGLSRFVKANRILNKIMMFCRLCSIFPQSRSSKDFWGFYVVSTYITPICLPVQP